MKIDRNNPPSLPETPQSEKETKTVTSLPQMDQDLVERSNRQDAFSNVLESTNSDSSDSSLLQDAGQLGDHKMYGMSAFDDVAAPYSRRADQPEENAAEESRDGTRILQGELNVETGEVPEQYNYWAFYDAGAKDGSIKTTMNDQFRANIAGRYANVRYNTTGVEVNGHNVDLNASIDVSATVEVNATLISEVSVGSDTYVKSGGEYYAGAKAKLEGSTGMGDFASVSGDLEGYAGVGGKNYVEMGLEDGKLKYAFEIGAAAGIGVGVGWGFEIDVAELTDVMSDASKQASETGSDVGQWLGDTATQVVKEGIELASQNKEGWKNTVDNTIDQTADAAEQGVEAAADAAHDAVDAVVEFLDNAADW